MDEHIEELKYVSGVTVVDKRRFYIYNVEIKKI